MPFGGPTSERILVLTSRKRDSELACQLFNEAGLSPRACVDDEQLIKEMRAGAGFLVLTDEIVTGSTAQKIRSWVREQPAWSDLPIIVLTAKSGLTVRGQWARDVQEGFGNVTLLERPFHPSTVISVARAALQSRRRQYEARDLLDRYELLARELQHRTKNLLAVIVSIASASLRNGGGGHEAFIQRLHALGKAQDLLMEGDGHGAYLSDLVHSITSSFGERVVTTGPKVHLRPSMAQGFALILHELATNAVKHGSLSVEHGRVAVDWSVGVLANKVTLHFKWSELDGPPAEGPKQKGFGSLLLERAIASINGPPSFSHRPEGFTYELTAELDTDGKARPNVTL
jgi:two-component sensor histidine kinase